MSFAVRDTDAVATDSLFGVMGLGDITIDRQANFKIDEKHFLG